VRNLTLFCGGYSTEHDITFLSAKNIINSIDSAKYKLTVIYISPNRGWRRLSTPDAWELLIQGKKIADENHFEPIGVSFDDPKYPWVSLRDATVRYPADVVFPVLHGTQGEDGCIQGLLTLLGIPFVGADTLTSAILMSKIRTKQILQHAGVSCVPFKSWAYPSDYKKEALDSFHEFGADVFIKAANLGSSVGVSHVNDEKEINRAFDHAFQFDEWVMMEPTVRGREIEVAVLGNRHQWQMAGPGEIISKSDFYTFDAKYKDTTSAEPLSAANLTAQEREHIFSVAQKVAEATNCEGMCRVDGFLTDKGFLVSEVNSIPGFTNISLYPGMWRQAGKPTPVLINDLLELAYARHYRLSRLRHSFST
jgi:D-alanine-D-alanine ligase